MSRHLAQQLEEVVPVAVCIPVLSRVKDVHCVSAVWLPTGVA